MLKPGMSILVCSIDWDRDKGEEVSTLVGKFRATGDPSQDTAMEQELRIKGHSRQADRIYVANGKVYPVILSRADPDDVKIPMAEEIDKKLAEAFSTAISRDQTNLLVSEEGPNTFSILYDPRGEDGQLVDDGSAQGKVIIKVLACEMTDEKGNADRWSVEELEF